MDIDVNELQVWQTPVVVFTEKIWACTPAEQAVPLTALMLKLAVVAVAVKTYH